MNSQPQQGSKIYFFVLFELLLVAALFFAIFALILLGDFGIKKLAEALEIEMDTTLTALRQYAKIGLVGADIILIGTLVLRGIVVAFRSIGRS